MSKIPLTNLLGGWFALTLVFTLMPIMILERFFPNTTPKTDIIFLILFIWNGFCCMLISILTYKSSKEVKNARTNKRKPLQNKHKPIPKDKQKR